MGTITVNHLGKAFKLYPSRWSRLREWLSPSDRQHHELKWVIKDVNFTVRPGEALGIIGINGAGKSTLLKMITGTTQPTEGTVHIQGRMAAMLELGMGFHPDFTGRQNALMAGQLLGVSSDEMERLMPEIEAFAEIGQYIDMPVRVFSSGMQVRLAFSVATAIRPDILIIDEALSVGDVYFQHKSFDRIRTFRNQGTTLLIVSHDKQAIQSICDRAILLNAGKLAMEGEPEAVMDYYNAILADHQQQTVEQVMTDHGRVQTISGTGDVVIDKVLLLDSNEKPLDTVAVGQHVTLRVQVVCRSPVESLVVGFVVKDRLGQAIFGTNTHHLNKIIQDMVVGQTAEIDFAYPANFGPGHYSIAVALHADQTHLSKNFEWRDYAIIFNTVNVDKEDFVGTSWLPTEVVYRT